jgi:HK97 family phage major capsid protein
MALMEVKSINSLKQIKAALQSQASGMEFAAKNLDREPKPSEIMEYARVRAQLEQVQEQIKAHEEGAVLLSPGEGAPGVIVQPRGEGSSPEQSWGFRPAAAVKPSAPVSASSVADLNRFGTEMQSYMRGGIQALSTPIHVGTGAGVESVGVTIPTTILNALAAYGNVDSFALAGARQIGTEDTNPLTLPVISSGAATSTFAEGASAVDSQPFNLDSFTFGGTKYSRLVKASEEALMNSAIDLSGTITDELANGVASTFTAAITTALLTALTGNANVLVAEGSNDIYKTLGSLLHAIPTRFAGPTNKWMLSRATLAKVKDLRADGSGVPLFDPVSGQIFARDVILNDSLSGGQVVYGEWSAGAYVRKTPFRIQRLVEAFASTGEIGFKATQWLDSKFLASLAGVTNQPLFYTVLA